MTKRDEFLSLYKEYEGLVKDLYGITPLQHQESLTDERLQGRLTLCRQFRNYLSHNNDGSFIEITNVHIKFLENYVEELSAESDVAKTHMKTIAAGLCAETDKCVDVLNKMIKGKMPEILVQTAKGYGIASIYTISQKVFESKTTKIKDVKLSNGHLYYTKPTTQWTDLPDNSIILVTKTGDSKDKVLGIIYKTRKG